MTGLPAQPTASVQPAVPAQFQTFLAFDFGLKRTGVASGNRMLRTASPQATPVRLRPKSKARKV